MIPDLNRLKIFCFVYTNKSVSKAAKVLKLSQPAVSQHLKKLERELRIPLFTRTGRTIVPTPAATRLFTRMSPLIKELEQEVKYIRRPLDTPYGSLCIGAPELFCSRTLTSVCNKFRYRFPTVNFILTCDNRQKLLSKLVQAEIDLALIETTPETADIHVTNPLHYSSLVLVKSTLVMVCSKSYYNRNIGDRINLDHLLQREYLSIDPGNMHVHQWFQHHYQWSPHDLNYVLTTNSHLSFLHGIKQGMGLGVIPSNLVETELEDKSLVAVRTSQKERAYTLSLVQLKNKETSLTEKSFISFLKKTLTASTRQEAGSHHATRAE